MTVFCLASISSANHGNCFAWIALLINIISLLFLATLSFIKINAKLRTIGLVWAVVALVGTIVVLVLHPCVYAIIAFVFAAMLLAALFVVCSGEQKPQFCLGDCGCYIIGNLDGQVSLSLFDDNNQPLAKCPMPLTNAIQAQRHAHICRIAAQTATYCNIAQNDEQALPSFAIFSQDGGFVCKLLDQNGNELLVSEPQATQTKAKRLLGAIVGAVLTNVFFAATANDDF